MPQWWAQHASPSTAPLTAWLPLLAAKVDYIRQWLQNGPPAAVWLPGLFAPQQFVAAVQQAHARERGAPVDTLGWRVHATKWRATADVREVRRPLLHCQKCIQATLCARLVWVAADG